MKLPANCKIELAASTDSTRLVITEAYLDVAADGDARTGTLVATDGRMLAILPVELGEHDASGFVGADVLKAARKVAGKNGTLDVTLNGKAEIGAISMPRGGACEPAPGTENDMRYPNWRQIEPMPAEDDFCVSFNASLLWKLAQALGTEGVTLRIPKDGVSPISVRPSSKANNARGVLMPMRMS